MEDYVTLQIGIRHPAREIDNFNVATNNLADIKFPAGKEELEKNFTKVCRDHELLGKLLLSQPEMIKEILDDVLSGRNVSAMKKARSIGLTEEKFQEEGGGLIGWVVVGLIAAAVYLYPNEAT